MSIINDCKLEKLEQDKFISLVWEVLNILFIVLIKKKGKILKNNENQSSVNLPLMQCLVIF